MEAPRRRLRALQRHVAAPERAAKDSADATALTAESADVAGFDVSEAETIEAHRYLFDLQGVRALPLASPPRRAAARAHAARAVSASWRR